MLPWIHTSPVHVAVHRLLSCRLHLLSGPQFCTHARVSCSHLDHLEFRMNCGNSSYHPSLALPIQAYSALISASHGSPVSPALDEPLSDTEVEPSFVTLVHAASWAGAEASTTIDSFTSTWNVSASLSLDGAPDANRATVVSSYADLLALHIQEGWVCLLRGPCQCTGHAATEGRPWVREACQRVQMRMRSAPGSSSPHRHSDNFDHSSYLRWRAFSSFTLHRNVLVHMHRGTHNERGYSNLTIPCGRWLAGRQPLGTACRWSPCAGFKIRAGNNDSHGPGTMIRITWPFVHFSPHLKHATTPWTTGDRTALIGYGARSLTLRAAGFRLPWAGPRCGSAAVYMSSAPDYTFSLSLASFLVCAYH